MKAFHTVAIPHRDIVAKRLTMDVFAADLWDVFKGRGPEEYTDSKTFFKKTHMTKNLQSILKDVQDRLEGKGGDGFQHIETPFGGGKTHALIAMYHYSKEWGAEPVVIVGTAMSSEDTVWGMIEKQLDGKIDKLSGNLAPGRTKLEEVLKKHSSVLILIDELLPYVTVAAGVKVGDTTLATQTITFIQQLSEVISSLNRVCVIASFPASVLDIADKKLADDLLRKMRKVAGRVERKITPVNPNDIPNIIRARLFSTSEKDIMKNSGDIISNFVDYCERESILPPDKTAKQYREEFEQTYPFLPQVIDVLYHNWGSFASFQRTRGVLRLLSLLIYSLHNSERSYITLADFDLYDDETRRELLDHIGNQFDSVISKDITDPDSGARRTDKEVSKSYAGLGLGTKATTAIFMSSFTSSGTNGATMNYLKRAASSPDIPSSVVGDVVGGFKNKLSYIKTENDRYLFTSEPNLNRLKLDKMESISDMEVEENERMLLETIIGKQQIKTKIWPKSPKDIDDSPTLKLVILYEEKTEFCEQILENKGESPRRYRNAVFFLCPSDAERGQFVESMKSRIALEKIAADTPNLNSNQKKEIADELKKEKSTLEYKIKKYYRILYVPVKDGLDKYDMGIPTVGEARGISDQVFDRLVSEQQIHKSIGPLVIKDEYLKEQQFANTSTMYESMLSMRGSRRPIDKGVIETSLNRGVIDGTFGLGEIVDEKQSCNYFKEQPTIAFSDSEIIMRADMCDVKTSSKSEPMPGHEPVSISTTDPDSKYTQEEILKYLDFGFDIPEGKMNDAWGILRLINSKFDNIHFQIKAHGGEINNINFKKIEEALSQMNAKHDLQWKKTS